ncbi:MAG: glycosyltransferase family 2 protein [Gammaproteobacteria bacterium]|nr:glycosyltransferase family 2 protein [Gammaproteobacteria bacterium]
MSTSAPPLHVSVVSHRHGALVKKLLEGLASADGASQLAVTLTVNVPEPLDFLHRSYPYLLHVCQNPAPRGFGSNHNAAFASQPPSCRSAFFCVLNPDTRVTAQSLLGLTRRLAANPRIGIIGPLVHDPGGRLEDSMRRVPRPWTLVRKALGAKEGVQYAVRGDLYNPEWIAGICMVFPSRFYEQIDGFDERYWLYYEDVDVCCRTRLAGYDVVVDPAVSLVHDARRASRRSPRLFSMHLRSALRFFSSGVYRRYRSASQAETRRLGAGSGPLLP